MLLYKDLLLTNNSWISFEILLDFHQWVFWMELYTMVDICVHYQPKATHLDQRIGQVSLQVNYSEMLLRHQGFQESQWYNQQYADFVDRSQPKILYCKSSGNILNPIYLVWDWIIGFSVKEAFSMPTRLLVELEWCPINTQKPSLPLRACFLLNISLSPFLFSLVICSPKIKVNKIMVMMLNSHHHTFIAVVNCAYRDTCPLCHILWSSSITIVSCSIEENGKLSLNWKLWIVGVVVENRVIFNELDNVV